jgi:hypothetical protein
MNSDKALFKEIKRIIADFDPVGIAHITPDDEFDESSIQIVSLLEGSNDIKTFTQQITNLFRREFGEGDFDPHNVERMSGKIWNLKGGASKK